MKVINTRRIIKAFPNVESCIKHLELLRWNNKPVCPRCNGQQPKKHSEGWKCTNKSCNRKFNVKTGTIFQNSKVPLNDWFLAIYLVIKEKTKGISSVALAEEIEVTQKTAWYMLQKIRIMIGNRDKWVLGPYNYVEADELYFGGIARFKHNLNKELGNTGFKRGGGHYLSNSIILGLIERGGKLVLKHVCNTKSKTIHKFIDDHLIRGSTIFTDGFKGYNGLNKEHYHDTIKHSEGSYVRGRVHTNTIESVWSYLQTGFKAIYKRPSDKYFQRYLDEFSEKFNWKSITKYDQFNLFLSRCECYMSYLDIIK